MDKKQIHLETRKIHEYNTMRIYQGFDILNLSSEINSIFCEIVNTIIFKDMNEFFEGIKEDLPSMRSLGIGGVEDILRPRKRSEEDLKGLLSQGNGHVTIEYKGFPSYKRDELFFKEDDGIIYCYRAFIGPYHLKHYTKSPSLERRNSDCIHAIRGGLTKEELDKFGIAV